MRHAGPRLCQDPHLAVVETHAVGYRDVGGQHAQLGEMHDGALAKLGEEGVGVHLRRRHVEAEPRPGLAGQLPGRPPQRIGGGVVAHQDDVAGDAAPGHRAVALQDGLQVGDGLVGVLAVDVGFGGNIPHPAPHTAPDADLDQPVHHVVEETDRAGLQKARGARAQHLGGRQLR